MHGERQLLTDKHVRQSLQHSCGVVDARVSGLAEEVGHRCGSSLHLLQPIDDAELYNHMRTSLNKINRAYKSSSMESEARRVRQM